MEHSYAREQDIGQVKGLKRFVELLDDIESQIKYAVEKEIASKEKPQNEGNDNEEQMDTL